MAGKLFGYARVSTTEQNLDRQIDILKEYGVQPNDIFTDKISGTKFSRSALDNLQKMLRPNDTIITESLSRLSRSTQDLLTILNDWQQRSIIYISIKEQIDFSTSTGKLMLTLMAALSQFERDVIKDRVCEGLASARARGRVGGRPRTSSKNLEKAIKLYEAKTHSLKEIQEITKVSQSVLYRALKEQKNNKETKK